MFNLASHRFNYGEYGFRFGLGQAVSIRLSSALAQSDSARSRLRLSEHL